MIVVYVTYKRTVPAKQGLYYYYDCDCVILHN